MKKMIFSIAMSLALCSMININTYAQALDEETENNQYSRLTLDEFGNEIDWDVDGTGNEEGAGDEGEYVPINVDLLDTERLEQNESEAESIADVINENKVDENETENGTVSLKFVAPDEWRGSNIKVSLYNKDLWKSFDVYIYKQNGFEGQEELPCGEYEIRGASVVGDTNRVYPLLTDANGKESFLLEQGGEKIVINVELAGTNDYINETKTEEEKEQGEQSEETEKQETALEKTAKEFMWDNLIFAVILIIGLVGFTLYKKRSDKDED